MNRCGIVLLTLFLLVAVACHHVDKNEQLAALDDAYQAGLLTKNEYEAKKLAISSAVTATPAPAAAPVSSAPPSSPGPVTTPVPAIEPKTQVATSPRPRTHALVATPPTVAAAPAATSTAPARVPPTKSSSPPTKLHADEPAPLPDCQDAGYKSGGQKGTEERFFAASPDQVRDAALSALDSLDFNIHKKSNREIEASKKRHLGAIVGAGGEHMILTFEASERKGTSGTLVTGRTKKHIVGYMAQKTWTDAVLAQIACKLSELGR